MKKIFALFITLILLAAVLAGCHSADSAEQTENVEPRNAQESAQRLQISVERDLDASVTLQDGLEELFRDGIQYRHVKNVMITLNGETLPFEDALRDGLIFPEDVFAYARTDARNGICEELSESNRGLTHFTYRYPEFDLRLIYDIYETPDGQQHFINDLAIFSPGSGIGSYVDFYDEETGDRLDREDWGITLEAAEVTSTGITLNCTQSGGQQIGTLETSFYILGSEDGFVENLDGSAEAPSLEIPLQMDGTCQIEIDWTDVYGEKPGGAYWISLYVRDIFDESQVHPLMMDYHDLQAYTIPFTIP